MTRIEIESGRLPLRSPLVLRCIDDAVRDALPLTSLRTLT